VVFRQLFAVSARSQPPQSGVQQAMLAIIEGFLRKGVDGLRLDIFNALYKDARFLNNPPSLRPLPSEDNADGFFQQQPLHHQPSRQHCLCSQAARVRRQCARRTAISRR
jgi:hypothetical protein